MISKVKVIFIVSTLGLTGFFTLKHIITSNNVYVAEKNNNQNKQLTINSDVETAKDSEVDFYIESSEKLKPLENKPKLVKTEQFKSDALSSRKQKTYQLSSTKESIEPFKNHIIAENCLNYIQTIHSYGSVENVINNLTNNSGYDYSDLKKQFEESSINCSIYDGKTEIEILATIDNNLIESDSLGNEHASLKYASMLSQRAVYAKDLYTHQQRIDFHRKSIAILNKLSAKGHTDSMLLLSILLSDYVNFPETYDKDEARRQMDMYESLTGKDMSK